MPKSTLLLVLCLLLCTGVLRAQPTDSLRLKIAQIFAPLDKSQVPTGYLAEYASPLLDMHYYTGTALTDSNLTDMTVLRYLRATIASARIHGTDTLPDGRRLSARLNAAAAAFSGAIPIAVQAMAYAAVRPDAMEQNLIQVQNNQVYDVPGRTQSPYQQRMLFVAAPYVGFSRTGSVSFVFRPNLHLASGSGTVSSVAIDFGNGQGYQAVSWNYPVSTSYTTAGIKRIKVKVSYHVSGLAHPQTRAIPIQTTVARESHFNFEVLEVSPTARYDNANGFSRYFNPGNAHSGGTAYVRYGRNHTQIRKPFIIAEGYNFADFAPQLIRCNNPNNTIEQLLSAIDIDFSSGVNFNDALEAAGYDVIYIDNAKGTDDIRRNAALFEEVVRWVNEQKRASGSSEQNVVMGQSMGG